jgi:2-polyprenylphenol 6-hydroxylase
MSTSFDIVIVGGGMVGLAMAASLVKSGCSIVIIEKYEFDDLLQGPYLSLNKIKAEDYTARVSAISPGNQKFLAEINCWQNIPENKIADYEKMHVWDGDGSGLIQFDAAENAQKILGSIVENQVIRAAIYKTISSYSNVTILTKAKIDSLEQYEDRVELKVSDLDSESKQKIVSKKISAKLLIGADGAFSTVRQKLAITVKQKSYEQIAFVANVKTELPHRNTAWQRFTKHGPIAFLPLPEKNLCSIVWSLDADKAIAIQSLSTEQFAEQVEINFERKLGDVTAVSDFQGFPLVKRHAHTYLSDRCALIGDAAHTIHPLAGQGVNLGFQDVACLSKLLIHLLCAKRDIGLKANLRPFERERKFENTMMQESMTGFKWLFGQQDMASVLLRNKAMNTLNNNVTIKQLITRRAMS